MKLRRFEVRWAETVGRSLIPRGVLGGVVDDLDLGEEFRVECLAPPWFASLLLRFSLWLTWFAPFWMSLRLRTFGGLDADAREALLEKLLAHKSYNVRMASMFLKLAVSSFVVGDARALAKLGAYGLKEEPLQIKKAPQKNSHDAHDAHDAHEKPAPPTGGAS